MILSCLINHPSHLFMTCYLNRVDNLRACTGLLTHISWDVWQLHHFIFWILLWYVFFVVDLTREEALNLLKMCVEEVSFEHVLMYLMLCVSVRLIGLRRFTLPLRRSLGIYIIYLSIQWYEGNLSLSPVRWFETQSLRHINDRRMCEVNSWVVFVVLRCIIVGSHFDNKAFSLLYFSLDSTSILQLNISSSVSVSPPCSWTDASSWTFPPSASVWLTGRASTTWRRSPLAPSDRSLLNYHPSRPHFSLLLSLFFFFVPLTSLLFLFQ